MWSLPHTESKPTRSASARSAECPRAWRTAPGTSSPRCTSGCGRRTSAASQLPPRRRQLAADPLDLDGEVARLRHHGDYGVEARLGPALERRAALGDRKSTRLN